MQAAFAQVRKPDDAQASTERQWLFIELRTAWTVGGRTHPGGALSACELERFLAGERTFEVLFEPGSRKSLAGFHATRNHVLVNELDNVRNRLYVLSRKGERWRRRELPGAPPFSSVDVRPVDPEPLSVKHRNEVTSVTVTAHKGRPLIASGGLDGSILVWDVTATKQYHRLGHPRTLNLSA